MNFEALELDAYNGAIVRIATFNAEPAQTNSTLLFASVELVAKDRPVPTSQSVDSDGVPQRRSFSGFGLAFRRVAMEAGAAVAWYRALQTAATLPIPRDPVDVGKFDGTAVNVMALADEPSWPFLATPLNDVRLFGSGDDFYPIPFAGSGALPAYIHRSFASQNDRLMDIVNDREACRWLSRRIHFDPSRHDELLGGAILVVPDPDVKQVRTWMARDADGHERLVGEVIKRNGRTLQDLRLLLFEERLGTMNVYQTFDVGTELMVADASDRLEQSGHALWHSERGLVDRQLATPYIRSISMDMRLVSRQVRVTTSDKRMVNNGSTDHVVDQVGSSMPSTITFDESPPRHRDVAARFNESAYRRQAEREAKRQDLLWFDEGKEARSFIRTRIGRANELVMIVDPYATAQDLFDFAHFVTRPEVRVQLLTSRLAGTDEDESRLRFRRTLDSFKERGLAEPGVRVMKGKRKPPLHDRFLVVDKQVWLSGNSLNNIGERASVMVKLPNASDVLGRLNRHYNDAVPMTFEIDGS